MTRTRIKVCGVKDADTAREAAASGADAVGLVFVAGSPREVGLAEAAGVIEALPAFVEPVALFSDEAASRIRETAQALGIRTVQLHGAETPEEVGQLAPLRVIKALPFDPVALPGRLEQWRAGLPGNLAGLLIDAKPAGGSGGLNGGGGKVFDWAALTGLQAGGAFAGLPRVILAGGLGPKNVAEAIRAVGPYAVDASSRLESSRGVKSAELIRAFCAAVRGADTSVGR